MGQVGSGGVADGVATTIPLASATNLPSDTAVVVVIDRVDSNGTSTPALEETTIGVVSGTNLINCVRGAEGTAQAHNAGAVVEVLVTAKGLNDLVDGLLVEHTQLGHHLSLCDTNGKTWIGQTANASAVNYLLVGNAITASSPTLCAAGSDSNIDLQLLGKGTGKVRTDARYGTITTDTISASAVTLNMATSNLHTVTLSHLSTTAINVSNVAVGQSFIVRLLQDASGTNLATWFSTITWMTSGGTAPTLQIGASKVDWIGFVCTSAGNYDGFVVGSKS